MNKSTIKIKGMHCRLCEILIEEELKNVKGVKYVSVSHQKGQAEISSMEKLDNDQIDQAIRKAGYSIETENNPQILSSKTKDFKDLGWAVAVAAIIFFLAKSFGILNFNSSVSGNLSNVIVVFLVGITAGVSTCMALVGGLVLGASARFSELHPNATKFNKFKPHIFFNLGRIVSYFILGGIIGFAGSIFQLSTSILGALTIAVGFVMLILGGQLVDIFPILKKFSFTLPKALYHLMGIKNKSDAEYSHKNSMLLGGVSFFLPCGFTQAMQLYAISTGSVIKGALTMGVFALGTAPGLLGIGGLVSFTKGKFSQMFFKTAGVIVIALAVFNISNGLTLLGIDSAPKQNTPNQNIAPVSQNIQEVKMTQSSYGYYPNKFTIKKGVPVKWIINSEDSYTCASSIYSRQLGIQASLQPGNNIFEFTPTSNGVIRFSCSMGMYSGSFTVTD